MNEFQELAQEAKAKGGLVEVTLERLRKEIDAGRLGKHVMRTISERMEAAGLSYFPQWVLDANESPRKEQTVRVYVVDTTSPLYRTVQAVLNPTAAGDELLRGLQGDEAAARATGAEDKLRLVTEAIEDALSIIKDDTDSQSS